MPAQLEMVPGKEALSEINRRLQDEFQISITPTGIIDAMRVTEIPNEVIDLIQTLKDFWKSKIE